MLVKEYGTELLRNFAWLFFPVGHSLFPIIRFYLWKISSLFRKNVSYSIWLYSSGTCTQRHWGSLVWLCWLRGQLARWAVMKPALWFLAFQLPCSPSGLDLVLMLYKLIVSLESLGDFRRSELALTLFPSQILEFLLPEGSWFFILFLLPANSDADLFTLTSLM